jgi:hypothetical protein
VTTLLDAALEYAAAGFAVFPCHSPRNGGCSCGRPDCDDAAKHPRTLDGLKSATCDEAQVREWWRRWPDANIAIATGAASGLVALDVDVPKGGAGTLAELERKHGALPRTAQVLTGGGGYHYLFQHPGDGVRNSVGKLGKGLDIRGDGGYVIAAPSIHISGRPYKWTRGLEQAPPTELPAWLLADAAERRNGHAAPVEDLIPQGERHDVLLSLAGTMRRRGLGAVEILAALEAVNLARCKPPVAAAELRTLADDVVDRWQPDPAAALRVAEDHGNVVDAARNPEASTSTINVHSITWQRLSEVAMRSIVFVDKPLLQADALHLLVGRKGQGKGTLLAEIASRITRGELGAKRNVVWIGTEDSASIDIKPRIVAAGGDPDRILIVKRGWIQLPRDVDEISHAITEMGDVGMLTIDPVSNHIAGKDSNSDTDIRDAIAPLNLTADEHKCMVFGVRHLSEKECSRGVLAAILGSSAWVQVPRAVLAVALDNEDPTISHVQCVAGNRLPAGTPGRMFRIEGVLLPELENEVTRAVWIGDSLKDVETMLSNNRAAKEPSKSAAARELILDILDSVTRMESDELDARVAKETGIKAKTVKNLRSELKDAGLIQPFPEKDEDGTVRRWFVARTLAPRDGQSADPDPEIFA